MRIAFPRRKFLSGSLAAGSAVALSALSYRRVLGANERIGIGFIGYGLIGKRHVADFKLESDASLVAISEVYRPRLEEGQGALGGDARAYPDFRKLLDDRRVDAVVVSTPDHWHALMTMLACSADKDVYVEKPLTLFQREGRWMIDVAQRTRRIVQAGTQQRSGLHYQRARDLIRGGHIGRVTSVRMVSNRNIGAGFGRPADSDPPSDLNWDLWLGPAPMHRYNPLRALYHFRWFWDYSGGQMTNLGAHHLDIVDWVLGLDQLKNVACVGGRLAIDDGGETPDTQDAIFDCGQFTTVWSLRETSRGTVPMNSLEFYGTKGSLGLSRAGFKVTADRNTPAANGIPGVGEHPAGGPQRVATAEPTPLKTQPIDDTSGSSDEQYRGHVRNFLDCIRSRQQPISDLASAHRTATACHLANLAMRSGRSLRWDAKSETIVNDSTATSQLTRPYRAPWDRELRALGITA